MHDLIMLAEADHQLFDRKKRHGYRFSLGSMASRKPSPSRVNPITLITIAAPGKRIR